MTSTDAGIVIVGGGLIGCMIAYELGKRGRKALVIERGTVGGQSSGVSFGSLRVQGQRPSELPLAIRSQELWAGAEAEIGESVEFERHGHVHLALDGEQEERLERNAAHARSCGLEVELLGGREAIRRWPFLSGRIRAASFSASDAVVNPRLVAPAFARAARRTGATILEGVDLVGAEYRSGRFGLRCVDQAGAEHTITAAILVNAAGAWAGTLAAWFAETIPLFAAGPAEMVTEPLPMFVQPTMHVVDGSVLFRQTNRGNVVIGGHPRMSVDAGSRRSRVHPEKMLTNLSRLAAIAPHLRSCTVIRSWTGIEGYVEDMMPVLGPSATVPGLFHACAFSGHGLQLGPAAAEAIAEAIATGATRMPISQFAIQRFAAAERRPAIAMAEEFQSDVIGRGGESRS